MTEHPILFSAPMVKALLDGRKTMTRRLVKPQPNEPPYIGSDGQWWSLRADKLQPIRCPYGVPGDRLWVRETFASAAKHIVAYQADAECGAWFDDGDGGRVWIHHGVVIESSAYDSRFARGQTHTSRGLGTYGGRWRPSIHMPRWASRITLEVTSVRVERLQEITADDAIREGIYGADEFRNRSSVENFAILWDQINAKRAPWASNPWVWCVSFRRIAP